MAKGDFGKAFGHYRKNGGKNTRKEYAEEFKKLTPEEKAKRINGVLEVQQ